MTRALALLSCAACFLLSHTAAAKPKVALTQIEGDASGDVHDAVAEAIEGKELSLISSREVNRAVDKLGDLADLTEKDFKKLASDLEVDAIVTGKLDRVGSSRTLRFRMFVHKKMAKGFTISFKDTKSEKFRKLLHNKMVEKIGVPVGDGEEEEEDARPAKKQAAEDEEDPLASKKARKSKKSRASEDEEEARPAKKTRLAKAEDEDARPAKKARPEAEDEDARPAKKAKAEDDEDARPAKKARSDDEADDGEAKAAAEDDEDAPRRGKKEVAEADDGEELELSASAERRAATRAANTAAIRLDIGGSVQQRSFKFNSNVAGLPRNITMSPVPGARLEGEVYPLGLMRSEGALAGLGIGFEYDRTLSANLTTTNGDMTYKIPVKESHYSVGLRYRYVFGSRETSPTLTAGVGYGKRLFSTNRAALASDPIADRNVRRDTPESEYATIDPGLMFRLPVTRMVAFSAGGNFLLVTKAGPVAQSTSYGRGKVYGAEAIAAVDVVLGRYLALRFAGEFVQIGFKFEGGGELSNGLDATMNLTSQEVGGLRDRSLGGSATIAVLY